MTEHTPGPWLARKMISGNWTIDDDTSGQPIARTSDEANARLIAAAPRLLEALTVIDDCCGFAQGDIDTGDYQLAYDKITEARHAALAAIRAATGDDGE